MILVCTDQDITENSKSKPTKDIQISDLDFPAQIIWDNQIILFYRDGELKLLKATKPLPEFVDSFKLYL